MSKLRLVPRVDLGCGMRKKQGAIGIDSRPYVGVDHVLDIGKDRLPFEDNSVLEIYSIHVFEHLYPEELFFCMAECFRIIHPDGRLHIEVPKAGTPAYYIHPDHKIQYVEDSFGFFQVPAEGVDPHGYLTGFWHVDVDMSPTRFMQHIHVNMYPNKPNSSHFPYKEITRYDGVKL